MFNHRHLRTFIAIADYGSFAVAAERTGLTQSAVSMQMKTLEEDLRATIFDRSRRSPKLNDLGRSLLEIAREIILLSDDLRQIASRTDDLAGSIRLGVISSVSTGALPCAIAQLGNMHPNFSVRIENGHSDDLVRRVREEILDAVVVTEPVPGGGDLTCRTIVEEPLLIVAPRDHTAADGPALLKELPFIRFNRGTGTGRIIDSRLRQFRIRVHETMELDSIEAILEMVSQGMGAAIVPEHCVTVRYIDDLQVLPFGEPQVHRKIGFVERVHHPRTAYTDALFEQLRIAEAARERPLGEAMNRRVNAVK